MSPITGEEVKRDLKRRYALAGLVVTLSVLSSLVLVFAEYPTYGNLYHGHHAPWKNWIYQIPLLPAPPLPSYTTADIQEIHFYFRVDGTNKEITIIPTNIGDYRYEFDIPKDSMRYGALADDTYIEIRFGDEWYSAVGPAPMWRRRP